MSFIYLEIHFIHVQQTSFKTFVESVLNTYVVLYSWSLLSYLLYLIYL